MSDDQENNNIHKFDKTKKRTTRNQKPKSSGNNSSQEEKPLKLSKGYIHERIFQYLNIEGPERVAQLSCYAIDPAMIHRDFNAYNYRSDDRTGPRVCLLDKEKGLATAIGSLKLAGEISECLERFVDPFLPSHRYCLTFPECETIAKQFMAKGRSIDKWPEPIGFKTIERDQDGNVAKYYFKRHDFDPHDKPTTYADFPTIALNLENMSNDRNFCERVGSLYDPEADRKQMILMVGEGDGGKSALLNLLTHLAGGPDGVAMIDMGVFNRFGFFPLVDKAVWLAEELNPNFFKNDRLKTLTGGAPVQIEPKREAQYNVRLNGMLFAATNKMPELLEDDSGLRNRIIICEVKSLAKELRLPAAETEKRMKAELPYFVRYCMDAYSKAKRATGSGTLVPDTTEALDNLIADSELVFEGWLNDYFVYGDEHAKTDFYTPNQWTQICDWLIEKHSSVRQSAQLLKRWNKYVAKILGRERHTVYMGKIKGRVISKIRLDPTSESVKNSGILEIVERSKHK